MFNKFLEFYIYWNIHVSIAVTSLLWVVSNSYDIEILGVYYGLVFSSSLIGYIICSKSFEELRRNKMCFLLIVPLLMIICSFFYLQRWSVLLIVVVSYLTLEYRFVLLFKKIRDIEYIKVIIVAMCWTLTTVTLPFIESYMFFSEVHLKVWVAIFLFVIALLIPFEIRDLSTDDKLLKTIPQLIGKKWSKCLGVILMLICFVLLKFYYSLVIVTVITICLILMSREDRGRYYTVFWVESVPIFWALLLFIEQNIVF